MSGFNPKFTITNRITAAITHIERARGFLKAARLSDDGVRDMGNKFLIREANHTTHIEGTRITLDQSERLWNGKIPGQKIGRHWRFHRIPLMCGLENGNEVAES